MTGPTGYISGSNLNYDGGSSMDSSAIVISGSNSDYVMTPGGSSDFKIDYTLIAKDKSGLRSLGLTLRDYNDPREVRFYNTAINVAWQDVTEESVDLRYFFHPLQEFSSYLTQTFSIAPLTSFNLDYGSFELTNGEVSLLMTQAEYMPQATDDERILYWNYKGSPRYVMGDFMTLSGAVKEGTIWRGWEIDPFVEPLNAFVNQGGIVFTNPSNYTVKIKTLIAN